MKKICQIWVILFLVLFLASVIYAQDNSATLSWNAPTLNADGTPCTDLAGYKVYYSFTSGQDYIELADIPSATTTVYKAIVGVPFDKASVVYFVATAYDTSGNESEYSNELFKEFDMRNPPERIIIEFVKQ